MKRSNDFNSDGPQKRRRQPQISCDSCRRKKLKCDRANPCSSCVIRGLPCNGQPASPNTVAEPVGTSAASPMPDGEDSILGRLRKLEQAVFGSGSAAQTGPSADPPLKVSPAKIGDKRYGGYQGLAKDVTSRPLPRRQSAMNSEKQQTAKYLDSTFTRYGLNISLPKERLDYRVTDVTYFPKASSSPSLGLTPSGDTDGKSPTWLMKREEALSLLEDFINNPFHLLPIVHARATRGIIDNVYFSLSHGEDPEPAHAALILSIAATSAFFFNENSESLDAFASYEGATETALSWFRSALGILERSQHVSYGCLEEVQARAILAYLAYNFEGCSGRFRFLHACSLSAAREAGLHLIDSPSTEPQDDPASREIKRRLWWHIVSTDWMLGLMGGPIDGTYSVHPRQMNVKYPRNIDEDEASLHDESINHPTEKATALSCFLIRIQLAEITRSIIDARAAGNPDAEITDYDQVLELDQIFAKALSEFPPFFHPNGPIPPGAPHYFSLQRDAVLLGFHSRRARLHRPFLMQDTQDALHQTSRDICLSSARTVLSIAMRLLKSSQASEPNRAYNSQGTGRRLGCVIGHMFMACTILALNAGLDTVRVPPDVHKETSNGSHDTTAETHAEVAEACHALASVGEESAIAARLVRNLVGVLRRYRMKGVDEAGSGSSGEPDTSASNTCVNDEVQEGSLTNAVETDYTGMLHENDLGLNGLWDDILGDTSANYGWDELFSGLDTYCTSA